MRKRAAGNLAIFAVIMGTLACAPDEICFTDNSTEVRIDFKRIIYPDTDSAFTENDTLVFSQITAVDTDSIFVQMDTLSSVILPLNTSLDVTTFLFDTEQDAYSLELQYQRTQRLISADCGPEQVFDQLTVEASSFDSLAVIQPSLIDPPVTNVEIYH
jgi:hypothetical protein